MTDRFIKLTSIALTSLTVIAGATAIASADSADDNGPPVIRRNGPPIPRVQTKIPAVHGGLEIALALNTAQTVGDIGGGMDANDTIGSATQVELQIGHRLTPNLALGFYSTAQAFTSGSSLGRDVYTGSAGIESDFHFRPSTNIDPWLSLGTGVRAMLADGDGTAVTVGAELVRLQLGVDFRLNEDVAMGPVIGASASLYGAEKQPMQDFAELSDKGINWTLTAGLAGRFNAFGSRR